MSKNFFVIIPYTAAPINITKSLTSFLTPTGQKGTPSDMRFEEQRIQLDQRVSIVEQGLSRVGVRTVPLQSEDLVELFYHIYNPTDPTGSAPVFNNN